MPTLTDSATTAAAKITVSDLTELGVRLAQRIAAAKRSDHALEFLFLQCETAVKQAVGLKNPAARNALLLLPRDRLLTLSTNGLAGHPMRGLLVTMATAIGDLARAFEIVGRTSAIMRMELRGCVLDVEGYVHPVK